MTVSLFDSALFAELLTDRATADALSDAAQVRAMLDFEAALARAEGETGVIPSGAAAAISDAALALTVSPGDLAKSTASAGVPVPALVKQLRAAVGGDSAQYVHWGATSQDVVDTGLVLRLRGILDRFEDRLKALADNLGDLAAEHRETVMAGRTRSQQATPTTFGLKAAVWREPILRHLARLDELRPRLLLLAFGGASGTLAALGRKAREVEAALAAELNLTAPPTPWHTQRDGIAELADWLANVNGSLGKMGQDLVLLAQSEIGEVRPGAGGGSSTMPQKSNPVGAEALVALHRFNAGLVGTIHQAMAQEQERGGAAWLLEWLTLPQMVMATGTALNHALSTVAGLVVDGARMRANLDASNGLILAEAATFALTAHMPRPDAEAVVKAACLDVAATGRHLIDLLAERSDAPIDWAALKDPANYVGIAHRKGD